MKPTKPFCIWKHLFPILLIFCGSSLFAQDAATLVKKHLSKQSRSLQLSAADIDAIYINSESFSRHNGVRHIYFTQGIDGHEILGTNSSIHILSNGEVLKMNLAFVPGLVASTKVNKSNKISPESAMQSLVAQAGYIALEPLKAKTEKNLHPGMVAIFERNSFAADDIHVRFKYYYHENTVRPIYYITLFERKGSAAWDYLVDAETGKIIEKRDLVIRCNFDHPHVSECKDEMKLQGSAFTAVPKQKAGIFGMLAGSYRAFALGVESPLFGTRTILTDPEELEASPFGWHDTNGLAGPEFTITRGNNTHTYEDIDDDNVAGYSTDGGAGLTFDFPINFTLEPIDYLDASITNGFVWTNLIHDVFYKYGFDEESGNFQVNNYGRGGLGNDPVRMEMQDGGDFNNANFATPIDGSPPRQQTYLWDLTVPMRDGAFDNVITVHEYGHGISTRLTGGPGVNCLNVAEQMGEGWSDYLALMLTMKPADVGANARGVGNYALGQTISGGGIRQYPYSTDMTINPHTYDDTKTVSVPHGLGSVWAAMLWDMTWGLIEKHGFNPDVYAPWNTGGNNLAIQLVIDGLKLQGCSPGFVVGRDAILAADEALTGGDNKCIIWNAFARRGLGLSADQGSSGSNADNTEAFDSPCITCYQDLDADGYGNPNVSLSEYLSCSAGNVDNDQDCDDNNADVNPAAIEICDGLDNNCDGTTDEGFDKWADTGLGATSGGSAVYDECGDESDTYTLTSSGYSSLTQDVGHLIYKTLCGDGSLTAQLSSISNTGGWASVFMRETLSQGSKKADLKSRLTHFVLRGHRLATNGNAVSQMFSSSPLKTWMRITRAGSLFTTHISSNGTDWQLVSSVSITMADCIHIGMMVESINNATPTTAVFANVEATGDLQVLVPFYNNPAIAGHFKREYEVSIMPNPASTSVRIVSGQFTGQSGNILIMDNLGRIVSSSRFGVFSEMEEMDINHLVSGMYAVHIILDDKDAIVKKLIVNK